jgi:4'-phosphopantetheinyl transferase
MTVERLFVSEAEALTGLHEPLRTAPDTVHVWAFTLDGSHRCLELCRGWLSDDERERADRFMFAHHRSRYTVAHGVLRRLLSLYCDAAPEALQFATAAAGKPALRAGTAGAGRLAFNLTHSETRGAIGVSEGIALGIDLEQLRSDIEVSSISGNYFFGAESEAIEHAVPALRDNTFFRYWVAKEAVLKAQGIGLGFPLDRFRVDFLPGGGAARIETLDPARLDPDWTVRMLPCETGWLGAVAARGIDWSVKLERTG